MISWPKLAAIICIVYAATIAVQKFFGQEQLNPDPAIMCALALLLLREDKEDRRG